MNTPTLTPVPLALTLVMSLFGCSPAASNGEPPDSFPDQGTAHNTEDTPTTAPGCSPGDRFTAEDLGPIIRWPDVPGLSEGATIADHTTALTASGAVRLYFWTNQGKDLENGVRSAISNDGLAFEVEEGFRIAGPYGHPKLVVLPDGGIRMFHLMPGGLGSSYSSDGLRFSLEEGLRISNADTGLDRVGGMSVIALAEGGYRGYFSNLGIPGEPPQATTLKSASSPDTLSWTVDEGVRIGEGAPFITEWSRQPYAWARGDGCVTLLYYQLKRVPTRLAYATSTDGVTFTEEHLLDVVGFDGPRAGPNVQPLLDGSLLLTYDAMDGTIGNHIRAARLTPISRER